MPRQRPRTRHPAAQAGPDPNGCGEPAPSSWRYAFYASYDLPARIDKPPPFVDAFAGRFNLYRPHDALAELTPAEHLNALSRADPDPSHIC